MAKATSTLNEQALKAYNHLLSIFSRVKLDIKTKLALFDSLVVPILLYGSDIWGIYNTQDVDKLHYRFCKYILGVGKHTSNAAVLGELGRFPLSVICKARALKYWIRVKNNTGSLIHTIYSEQYNLCHNNDNPNRRYKYWCSNVKHVLNNIGYSDIFNHISIDSNYSSMFDDRLKDQYIQKWNETLLNQPKMETYILFKSVFQYELYLDILNDHQRRFLSKLRLSSHNLEIETGRYMGLERADRTCKCCNLNMCESEYQFLLCCPAYLDLRLKFGIRFSWPSQMQFKALMSSAKPKTIQTLGKFIHSAFKLREEKLQQLAAS